MGFVLSKFRKKKPSAKESLEKIDKELRDISRFQIDTEVKQKRIIGRFLIFSVIVYIVLAAVLYFLAPPGLPLVEKLLYAVPFVVLPVLIWLIKWAIGWYYDRKIVNNREKYQDLKKEKEQILEDVMDTETFKVAKEILEKYAPSHLLPKYLAEQQKAVASMSPLPGTPQSYQEGLRRRQQMAFGRGPTSSPLGIQRPAPIAPSTPTMRAIQGQLIRQPSNPFPRAIMPSAAAPAPSPPALGPNGLPISPRLGGTSTAIQPARPSYSCMLPPAPLNPVVQNRSMGWMDKLVDYVIGDGASHRYALICRYCATHNGLATPEDFPYTGFRCVFCAQYNPPKQVRPAAPRLPINTVLFEELDQSSRDNTAASTTQIEEHPPSTPGTPRKESQPSGSTSACTTDDESKVDSTQQDQNTTLTHDSDNEGESEEKQVLYDNFELKNKDHDQDEENNTIKEEDANTIATAETENTEERQEHEHDTISSEQIELLSRDKIEVTPSASACTDECSTSGFVMVDKSIAETEKETESL